MADVSLRPAVGADRDFLLAVYASTRTDELAILPWSDEQKAAFVAQQFAARSAQYAEHYSGASFEVVLVDGERAGRLIVARREGDIRIVDVALLPGYRGRGIGTQLLAPLIAEAEERGVPVALHVERHNPALRLYARLGFAPVSDEGIYLRLERPPGGAQLKTA